MIDEVVCHMCGKPLDIFDRESGFEIIVPRIGYGSIHDGQSCDLCFCCSCFDKLAASCKISPFYYNDDMEDFS